jgi:dTDP-4-dehydrorhamnose reductase
VADAIARHRPWAVVQAGDSPGIDAAEIGAGHPVERHTLGHAVLARACADAGVDLLTFSSDQVFDGRKQAPYVETDDVCPINAYGRSKAAAERQVLQAHPASLVLRTGGFFSPWDRENFLSQAMATLTHGRAFTAANDVVATPVFLPDLVNAALDLLVDRETGLWHVTHAEPVTWAELVARTCAIAGVGARGLRPRSCEQLDLAARRPPYTALASNRSTLLPALDDALGRYVRWNEGVLRSGLPRISAA